MRRFGPKIPSRWQKKCSKKKKKTTVDLNQHIFTHIFVRQTSTNNKIDHVHQKYSQLYRKNTNNK